MKKILMMFLIGMFLINFVSAFDFDNKLEYSNNDLKVNIKNVFGLGKDFGSAELKSHNSINEIKEVQAGRDVLVMYYEFNFNELYKDGLGEVSFINMKKEEEIEKDYNFKYLIIENVEVDDYEYQIVGYSNNGSAIYDNVKIGSHLEERRIWKDYNSKDIPKGKLTIGLFTEVDNGDYTDGVWKIAGKKIEKHASWTANLDNDIIAYWNFEEVAGDLIDQVGGLHNGTVNGATVGATGIIGDAYDFDGINDYVNISDHNDLDSSDTDFSINAWLYIDKLDGTIVSKATAYNHNNNNYLMLQSDTPAWNLRVGGGGNTLLQEEDVVPTTNVWYMMTLTYNATGNNLTIYINGSYENSTAPTVNPVGNAGDFVIGAFFGNKFFNGTIDEIGFWNRTLGETDVSDLWNSGAGVTYGASTTDININLTNPSNNTDSVIDHLYLNATYNISTGAFNWTNASYFIFYDNGSIYNDTQVETITGTDNFTGVQFQNISIGKFNWNIYACYENDTNNYCNWSDKGNYTFTIEGNFTNFIYNYSILETDRGNFSVDLAIPIGNVIQAGSGKLIYNGTIYSQVTVNHVSGNTYRISKNIFIPTGVSGFDIENRTFHWNITIINSETGSSYEQDSEDNNQTVNELMFELCNGDVNIPVLNFTMIDEDTGDEINATTNATTFQATFELGAFSTNLLKNYSINNISVDNSTFNFCTANYSKPFYSDMESFYTAVDYTDKSYFLNNASLDNITNEINLYLLQETNALEFFISVEQDLDPVDNATVNIQKYFVGEGVYKTVEIDETDTDGEFTSYLDLDKKYRFTITKDGSALGIISKRASCDAAPCELTLSLTSASANPFSNFDSAYAANVVYNLSFDPNTNIVTFDFVDTTGLANYFRMVVYNSKVNQSSIVLYDTSLYTSSGSMTFNVTGYEGDFYVETFVSRSPEILVDIITFIINTTVKTLGVLGLFVSLLLILTIIFGLSFKPSMLVMAVPLALTTLKLMSFINFSNTAIVFTYVLGIIALFALSK